jgi:hypothetical protein
MQWYAKLRNIERDPRVVLSFEAPRERGAFLNPYAVLHARSGVAVCQTTDMSQGEPGIELDTSLGYMLKAAASASGNDRG